jgi:hypothetical protein
MRLCFSFIIGIGGVLSLLHVTSFPPIYAAAPPSVPCPSFLPGCANDWGESKTDYKENHLFTIVVVGFIKWIMALSASAAVLMGVISGVMFVAFGGNEDLRGKAKKTFVYAGVGLLVSMFSYFIVEMINRLPFIQ